ncbi:MAG: 16S rRNA (adenine(1518)-N(6)/adenine(1519)-N(6))-dimethyltransferase RsmA [Cyanobacteria bacterium]|nr:16S rRNA (adenine(1518)-N(6)/adenine(1519)-N(6))-dimethyltransferase RsmA [Cyanobacteriota bacterium]MDW8203084.1 16S rRNA (adenine(1518)-N(6)/adenine(1519)-N(6))-dimethyltransferase RsmA [Cyanobacteriota bacterium SKYGB_h_bin112]
MAIKARKQFGQHWLRDEQVLQQIVAAAELCNTDCVLEIGPGTGILTRRLLPLVKSLLAVELDRDLCQLLTRTLGQHLNFLLLQGDFLSLDLGSLLQEYPLFQDPNKVVANIPYNITGPILERLLGTIAKPQPCPYQTIVLLVQKEVAERLCARPGSKVYGALSVRVQYLAACELICSVPAKSFSPPPQVDSAVIRLRPRRFELAAADPVLLQRLVTLGFATRRKMLRNNLKGEIERDHLSQLLAQLDIPTTARAEDLSPRQWVMLSNCWSTGSSGSFGGQGMLEADGL